MLARRYELVQRLAAGDVAEVWRGMDVVLARPVAVKLLQGGFWDRADVLARFRAGARRAGSVVHQNIARVYDYDEPGSGHPPFLVMEFVDGPTLSAILNAGPMAPARVMDLLAQTAAGLHAAHQAGLVHGDVTPATLMLTGDGVVKIIGFGMPPAAPGEGGPVGAAPYLAPERRRGDPGSPVADVYSLGIIGYQCLTSMLPIGSGTPNPGQVSKDHRWPPVSDPVPREVAALVSHLAATCPADRPRTAGEVARRASELRDRLNGPRFGQPYAARAGDGQPAREIDCAQLDQLGAVASTQPLPRVGHKLSGRWMSLPVAAAVAVLAAFVLIGVIGHRPAHQAAVAKTATVNVNGAALRGLPVAAVRGKLRRLGMQVRVLWRPSTRVPAGRVLAVRPAGDLPIGTLVVVVAAVRPTGLGHSASSARHRSLRPRAGSSPTQSASPTPSASQTPSPSPSPSPSPPSPSPTPSASATPSASPGTSRRARRAASSVPWPSSAANGVKAGMQVMIWPAQLRAVAN
jgi:hypothetical protein